MEKIYKQLNVNLDIINEKFKYASFVKQYNYLTDNIKNISNNTISYLYENVNRLDTINKFNNILYDMDKSILIEAGIFEFTLIYGATKNIINTILISIYQDKVDDLIYNLSFTDSYLLTNLKNNLINPQYVAFLKPHELNPDGWAIILKKINMRENSKKNMGVVDTYKCPRCKEKKCRVMQLQIRSADEPISDCVVCTNCYHRFIR